MAFKKRFQVSDESINSYGFWIRTAGIRLENAKKNCPAYFNHRTWEIPLGHWEDIEADVNGILWATLVIEGANEDEKNYIRKIENGDIKGASIGADCIKWITDELFIKQGQTVATLWDSELFEISLAPLPGNKNALALKHKESMINLSDGNATDFLPPLQKSRNMKRIALKLGLPETATEEQIIDALAAVQLTASNTEAMRKHIDETAATALETPEQKALFAQLSKSDFPSALVFLNLSKKTLVVAETIAPVTLAATPAEKQLRISDLIKPGGANLANANAGKDTYDYLQKHNVVELQRLNKEEPAKYKELAKAYAAGVRYTGN